MKKLTNKIALGTANFGLDYGISNLNGQLSENQIHKILNFASSSGITDVDTAPSYGHSEEVIGKFSASTLNIVTKLDRIPEDLSNIPLYIEEQLNKSLKLLNRQNIYGLLLHSPNQLTGPIGSKIIETLDFLKTTGRIQKVGISIYSPEILDSIWNQFIPDIVQAPFNLFDQRLLNNEWVKKLISEDVEIHLRSAFLQGLLTKPINTLPAKFSRWQHHFVELEKWQAKTDLSRVELALRFCLSQSWANKVIVGVDTVEQLVNLIALANSDTPMPKLPKTLIGGVNDNLLIDPVNWGSL